MRDTASAARHRISRAGLVVIVGIAVTWGITGCASTGRGLSAAPSSYGAPSAREAAAAFLEATRQREYTTMGRHFGTREGPAEARLGLGEVEQRMIVLAGLLAHDEARLRREELAGLGEQRERFVATLSGTRQGRVSVPVVTVVTPRGRWFVERLGVEALSRSTGG